MDIFRLTHWKKICVVVWRSLLTGVDVGWFRSIKKWTLSIVVVDECTINVGKCGGWLMVGVCEYIKLCLCIGLDDRGVLRIWAANFPL